MSDKTVTTWTNFGQKLQANPALYNSFQNLLKEHTDLVDNFNKLKEENTGLQAQLEQLKVGGKFTNTIDHLTLVQSLQDDLIQAHKYATSQDADTVYVIPNFTINLQAVVTQDKDGKPVYALPTRPGEFQPSDMSTITLHFLPIPLNSSETKQPSSESTNKGPQNPIPQKPETVTQEKIPKVNKTTRNAVSPLKTGK